jgi:hypothetical protein
MIELQIEASFVMAGMRVMPCRWSTVFGVDLSEYVAHTICLAIGGCLDVGGLDDVDLI